MQIASKFIALAAKNLAQWNANALQGNSISTTAPVNGQALIWDSASSKWTPKTRSFVDYGNGSDGSPVFDGTNTFPSFATTTGSAPNLVYTIIRDVWFISPTINSSITVKLGQNLWQSTGTTTLNGHLSCDGNAGGNAAVAVGGTAGAILAAGMFGGSPAGAAGAAGGTGKGGTQTAGTNGAAVAASQGGGAGGAGGNVGTGGSAAAGGTGGTATDKAVESFTVHLIYGVTLLQGGAPGGSGAGGINGANGNTGGGGGGSGSGGGVGMLIAQNLLGSGSFTANGGAGGNGAAAVGGNSDGGGGGGGGGGGALVVVTDTNGSTVTFSVNGGAAGTGGAKTGTGTAGQNGTAGNAGMVGKFDAINRTWS